MKLGQTSLVVFVSKLLASALGFLATLYLARTLGAEVIGVYALVMTVVGWLILAGELGIGQAVIKRISEGTDQGAYLTAATLWVLVLAGLMSVGAILGRSLLESYVAEFDRYIALSVVWFVVVLVFAKLSHILVFRALKGERKVHIAALLKPVKIGVRSLVQVGLVVAGYGLLGMFVGTIVAGVLVAVLGLVWVSTRPSVPGRAHFRSLFDYAKFSWLGGIKTRAFNEVDILVLGVFVPSAVVGVYSVAWSIAKFLDLFGGAIRSSVFPEISYKSTEESNQAAAGMLEDALAYGGLLAIPGLVGGLILGERLLRLYGEEFVEGTAVLGLLILAVLLFSYQKQLVAGLNGLDRPDLAFRVNAIFVAVNVSLNLLLVWQYGVEGAAAATVLSTAVGLVAGHRALSRLVEFGVPYAEIGRQFVAALAMGGVVTASLRFVETTGAIGNNAVIVVGLVGLGGGVYFLSMLALSRQFRRTVDRNLPVEVPAL